MKKLFVLMFLFAGPLFGQTYYKDGDWNFEMISHHNTDIRWQEESGNRYLEFKLSGGLPGTAYNDNTKRHGAAFWERNEAGGAKRLGRNNPYTFSFRFRVLKGFTGERETFFQIHSWSKTCQSAYPQIMMKFDQGLLQIDSLNPKGFHTVNKMNTRVDTIYNRWIDVRIATEKFTDNQAKYTFKGELFPEDGFSVVANLYDCSDQWPKFGIYRPGRENGTNEESVINFDKVTVQAR